MEIEEALFLNALTGMLENSTAQISMGGVYDGIQQSSIHHKAIKYKQPRRKHATNIHWGNEIIYEHCKNAMGKKQSVNGMTMNGRRM